MPQNSEDRPLARGLGLMLKSGGAVVDHCDTGAEALELARHYDYDIVLLDLMLPDMEGHEVVRRMRSARIEVPVLVLSALSSPQAKVKAFGAGADDFLCKPFDKTELLARAEELPDDEEAVIPDERLELIFACCHPALAPEAQVALTLSLVGGLDHPLLDAVQVDGDALPFAEQLIIQAPAGIPGNR